MTSLKNKLFILYIATCSFIYSSQHFNLINIPKLLRQYPNIQYKKCFGAFDFNFKPFPLSINPASHPNKGRFDESFIVTIPQGYVQGIYGLVTIDNYFIQELMWKKMTIHLQHLKPINSLNVYPIVGKVAVITQLAYFNYWHFLTEVLCRLALLELSQTAYDYVYVTTDMPFIKDMLTLWGIEPEKIITPTDNNFCIQASQLIVPSLTSNTNLGKIGSQTSADVAFACYVQPHLIKYVRNKLLNNALQYQPTIQLHKKIFISRKDSNIRNITNEDEIYAMLQQHGFVRYELSKLSVVNQIQLFHNAEIILCPQGTGMANSLFCTSDTQLFELFQGLNDCTFWYLSQIFSMNYTPIQTTNFIPDWYKAWQTHTYMPPKLIENLLQKL